MEEKRKKKKKKEKSKSYRSFSYFLVISCMFIFLQTPGPGTYNTTEPQIYRDKAPQYSMTSRNVMPGDTTQKPGPGAHSPEIVSYGPNLAQIHLITTFGIVWGLLLVKCLLNTLR